MRLIQRLALSLLLVSAAACLGCDDDADAEAAPEGEASDSDEDVDTDTDDAGTDAEQDDDPFAGLELEEQEGDDEPDEETAGDPLAGILGPAEEAAAEAPDEAPAPEATPAGARHVAHVLVRFTGADRAPEDVTRTREEAEARARQALARAQSSDFGAVAQEFSDDDATSSGGGDLGSFERGLLPGPLESAVFSMQVGEIQGPIETDLGYHIVTRLP